MLLDCDNRTLTVYVNSQLRGVIVQPGMKDVVGSPCDMDETGSLRWDVDVGYGCGVRIRNEARAPAAVA